MSILSDYLERRRQIQAEEAANRAAEDSSPQELLEALKANTEHTSDLIGERSKEARYQSRQVLDSLELVATSVDSLKPPKSASDENPKPAQQAQFKVSSLTNKNLIEVNDTLKKLLATNELIEKHLRPELNSKDDTYAKRKEDANVVSKAKEKAKPAGPAGPALGGLLANALFDLFDKKPKPTVPSEAPKPSTPKPVATSTANTGAGRFGYRAGRFVGGVKNVLGGIGSKIGDVAKPLTTKFSELASKAAGTDFGKSATKVGSTVLEAGKTVGSKSLEYAARAKEALTPTASKVATAANSAFTSAKGFGSAVVDKLRLTPALAEGVAPKALGAVESVAPAAKATTGVLGTAAKWAGRLATPLAVGMAGYEAYGNENNEALSRDQKNVKHGGTAVGLGGGLAGASAGAALGATVGSVVPVVGTAIGGVLGGIGGYMAGSGVGSYVGEKGMEGYQYARDATSRGMDHVSDSYASAKDTVGKGWDWAKGAFSSAKDVASSGIDSVVGGAKSVGKAFTDSPISAAIPGVGLAAMAGRALSGGASSEAVGSLGKSAMGTLSSARDMVPSGVSTALGASVALAVAPFSEDARLAVGQSLTSVSSTFTTATQSLADSTSKTAGTFSEGLKLYTKSLTDSWDSLKSSVSNGAASAWAGAKKAMSVASDAVSGGYEAAKQGFREGSKEGGVGGVVGGVVGAVKKGGKATAEGFTGITDKTLGAVSERFESGGRGVGTVSTGKGDAGGVSYGKHQLATNNGSMAAFLGSAEGAVVAKEFAGLTPGTAAFTEKYKQVTSGEGKGAMNDAQQAYMQRTHFEPQAAKLKETLGLDVGKEGRAVQEAVFSTATQYGPNSSLISKALAGKDLASMSDAEKVNAIQDYKAANVDKNFASSDSNTKASVAKRIENERKVLADIAADPNAKPATAALPKSQVGVMQQGEAVAKANAGSPTGKPASSSRVEELKAGLASAEGAERPCSRKIAVAKARLEEAKEATVEAANNARAGLTASSAAEGRVAQREAEYAALQNSGASQAKIVAANARLMEAYDAQDNATASEQQAKTAQTSTVDTLKLSKAAPVVQAESAVPGYRVPKENQKSVLPPEPTVARATPAAAYTGVAYGSSDKALGSFASPAMDSLSPVATPDNTTSSIVAQQAAIAQQAADAHPARTSHIPSIASAKQGPMPTLAANVPEETTQVEVTNQQSSADVRSSQSTGGAFNKGNAFDTAMPKLDNIPLQITDLGLVLLNIGHV